MKHILSILFTASILACLPACWECEKCEAPKHSKTNSESVKTPTSDSQSDEKESDDTEKKSDKKETDTKDADEKKSNEPKDDTEKTQEPVQTPPPVTPSPAPAAPAPVQPEQKGEKKAGIVPRPTPVADQKAIKPQAPSNQKTPSQKTP